MLINNVLFRSLKDILSDPTKNFESFGVDPNTKQPFKSSVSVFFYRQENNKQTKIEQLVDFMVHFMEPVLTLPEENVFKQGEQGDALYFISSGGVAVYQRILCGMREKKIGNLKENQHFGELSLLYNCQRTASIKSNKYSILAKISKAQFFDIIEQYPTFQQSLRMHAMKYKDSRNQSVSKLLKRFLYFKHLDVDFMKEVVYNLKVTHYFDRDVILAAGSQKNDLGLVLDGYAAYEMYTQALFMPLKMIRRGMMINYDRCAVRKRQVLYLRSVEHTSIAWMKQSTFLQLCEKYPAIANARKRIQQYIFSSLIRPYALDYMAPEKRRVGKNHSSRGSSHQTHKSVGSQTSVIVRAFTHSNEFHRINRMLSVTDNRLNKFSNNRVKYTNEGHRGIFKFKNVVIALIMEYRKMRKVTGFLEKLNVQIQYEQYSRINAYSMNYKPYKLQESSYEEEEEELELMLSDDDSEDEVQDQKNYIMFRQITAQIQTNMRALIQQLSSKTYSITRCNTAIGKSLRFLALASTESNLKRRLSSFSEKSEESDGYLTVFEQWLKDNELPDMSPPRHERKQSKDDGETDSDFWRLESRTEESVNL